MRKRKDHMKIRRVNDYGYTFIHPEYYFDSLTVRTVPVTAGIVMVYNVTAIGTLADSCTQHAGITVQYSVRSIQLLLRQYLMYRKHCIGVIPDLLDNKIIHDHHHPLNNQMGW